MLFPALTAMYAGLFGLILAALSVWVVAGRVGTGSNFGDGPGERLRGRVRAHSNFTEYVPLILLIVALLELMQTRNWIIHALLLPLLLARVAHPFGMIVRDQSPQQLALRGGGTIVTLAVLAIASVLLLARAF